MGDRMKKELMEYFYSIKSEDLPSVGGRFVEDDVHIRKFKNKYYDVDYSNIFSFLFNDDIMCVKSFFQYNWRTDDIFELVSGDYFNKVGVLSVVGYPVEFKYKSILSCETREMLGIATHNLKGIPHIDVAMATDVVFEKNAFNKEANIDNWFVLNNSEFREKMESVMTKECFQDYLNLFLADKVGGYLDRRPNNYFFYKKKGASLWEGVIAIDNGITNIGKFTEESRFGYGLTREIEKENYWSYTPQGTKNMSSQADNINEINELLQAGKFGENEINALKKIIQFPYEENMKYICDKYNLNGSALYDNTARLWEYNRENLSM